MHCHRWMCHHVRLIGQAREVCKTLSHFLWNMSKGKLKGGTRVHVIFDRYCEYSIKSGNRCSCKAQVSREHQLYLSSPLPPLQVALTATKKQKKTYRYDLWWTCVYSRAIESSQQSCSYWEDTNTYRGMQWIVNPETWLEDHPRRGRFIIPHQVVYLASLGCCSIKVISDDTDVFCAVSITMPGKSWHQHFSWNPQVKDAHQLTLVLLLPNTEVLPHSCFHALSGCDTVASYFGIGKTKVVKVLEARNRLNHLENPSANLEDVLCESTAFIAACYDQKCEARETMTDVHYKVWVSKTERKGACLLPKLKAIPPTLEAFKKNIKRAHFQAYIMENYTTNSGGVQGKHNEGSLSGMHYGKTIPPTQEVFKENIKRAHFQACIMENYTTDSGGVQGKHKEGSLSGMHMENCFGRGASKPWPIKIWVGQRWSC